MTLLSDLYSAGDVTATANLTANAVVVGDDGAKGVKKATVLISDAGEMTNSSQPCFLVTPTSDQLNFAEDTDVTVIFGTEVTDQGDDFASNTFTAPVDGNYLLNVMIRITAPEIAYTYYRLNVFTSNRAYAHFLPMDLTADPVSATISTSIVADMDASDTAFIAIKAQGTGGEEGHYIHAIHTFFSGALIC